MTAETHPQRAQIVAMLMDTSRRLSTRQIAETIVPPLSHATIARFRAKLLGHATHNMKGSSGISRSVTDLAAISNGTGATESDRENVKSRIREELQHAVETEKSLIDRYRQDAETSQHVHPITGEVQHNMNHGALARHTRNKLSTLELSAKLSGLLQESGTGGATIRAVVLMPSPGEQAGAPVEPGRLAVEIDMKR